MNEGIFCKYSMKKKKICTLSLKHIFDNTVINKSYFWAKYLKSYNQLLIYANIAPAIDFKLSHVIYTG